MYKRKLKLFLSLFILITLVTTVIYAAEAEVSVSEQLDDYSSYDEHDYHYDDYDLSDEELEAYLDSMGSNAEIQERSTLFI